MSEIVEKSVIGAILIDPKCVSEIYEQIRLEMFGSSFCRSVYAEILKAYDAGKQIILISIAQKLQGESFSQERIMQELKGILPDIQAYKIKSYADALVAEYKTRRLKEMLSKIIPAAGIVDEQINTMLQELEAMKENDTVKIHALSEIVDSISDGYFKEPDTEPLYTGLEKLDNTLGGLEGGDMIVIGARPAVGKSAFVTQIAINLADRKKKIAFYNLEMSDKQVYERLLSRKSRIGLNRIRRARSFLGDEKDRFDKANQELKKSTLFIRSGAVTVSQIRNECRHLDLDCIVIDYIQLLRSDIHYQSRANEVGAISKAIKALAMELNIPIIALSQLNRVSEMRQDKVPTMGELREAGDIEQDASIILLMWNIVDDKKGLKVEKNRQGILSTEVLRFDGDNMQFIETDESIKEAAKGFRKAEEPTPFD